MSRANGNANGSRPALRRNGQDMTVALRMRRYRQRKNEKKNNVEVTVSGAASVTISTVEMCGLAARLGDGCASADDLKMADKLIVAFAMQFPADSMVMISAGEISDDQDDGDGQS
jgi:hypothetical protein